MSCHPSILRCDSSSIGGISRHFLTLVNCDPCFHCFIAGSITLLLRVCVKLLHCYRYSILRRVYVSIFKHFLTWLNCDHCSHYYVAGSITLLPRVFVNLVQCYQYSILRRVCVRISNHFFTRVNCDQCPLFHCRVYHTSPEGVCQPGAVLSI